MVKRTGSLRLEALPEAEAPGRGEPGAGATDVH